MLQRLDSYIDLAAIEAEHERYISFLKADTDALVNLYTTAKSYKGTDLANMAANTDKLSVAMRDANTASAALVQSNTKLVQAQKEHAAATAGSKKNVDDLTLATREYSKINDGIATTQAKNNALSSNAAENLAIEKRLLAERNKELSLAVNYLVAETGSIEEARAAVAQLIKERDKLNLSTAEARDLQTTLNTRIDQYNAFIKQNVSGQEQQRINVGNYSGALKVLEQEVTNVNSRLELMTEQGVNNGEAFEKLMLESKLLTSFLEQNRNGFSSITQELRTNERALFTLSAAGLENTETFKQMRLAIAETKESLTDLKDQQKILATDIPAVSALASAARGLGGAYALGAGASALFADGNSKVEKELSKLVAIMILLQGLEESIKAIKERGAIVVALQVTAEKALVLVRSIEAKLFGEVAVAETALTTVTETNIAATEANAVAVGVNTTAMEGTIVATEGATVATIGLRTALISTGIGALIIGIIYGITKLVGLISDWANADEKAAKQQKEFTEGIKLQNEALQKNIELVDERYKDAIADAGKENDLLAASGQNYESLYEAQKKVYDLQKKQADEKLSLKIAQAEQEYSGSGVKGIDALNMAESAHLVKFRSTNTELIALSKEKNAKLKDMSESERKTVDERIEDLKKTADEELKSASEIGKIKIESFNAQKNIDVAKVTNSKKTSDEEDKIDADSAKRRYDVRTAANALILSNEESTLTQRVAAIRSNSSAERALADQKIQQAKSDMTDGTLTAKEGANEIANINTELGIKLRDNDQKIVEERKQARIKFLTAEVEILKIRTQTNENAEQEIFDNSAVSLEKRLDAYARYTQDQKDLIEADFQYQKKTRVLTDEELLLLETDRDAKLIALSAGTNAKRIEIVHNAFDEEKKLREQYYSGLITEDETNNALAIAATQQKYSNDVLKLNAQLQSKQISLTKYNEERLVLDDKFNKQSLIDTDAYLESQLTVLRQRSAEAQAEKIKLTGQLSVLEAKTTKTPQDDAEIKRLKFLLSANKDYAKEIADIEGKMDENRRNMSDKDVEREKAAIQFKAELQKQLANEIVTLFKTIIEAGYTVQLNALQELKDQSDSYYAKEQENIKNSSLSEQDKAAKSILLKNQQDANDKLIDQRQREIKNKQAQAERLFAIGNIIASTAMAEVQALTYLSNPFTAPLYPAIAALIGTIGAVQLATLLATPIPHYELGTDYSKGGWALTDEKGPEYYIEPTGRAYMGNDVPTLRNLVPGTKIISADKVNEYLYGSMMKQTGQQISRLSDYRSDSETDRIMATINDTLLSQTDRLERAIAKSKKKTTVNNNINLEWGSYIQRKTFN